LPLGNLTQLPLGHASVLAYVVTVHCSGRRSSGNQSMSRCRCIMGSRSGAAKLRAAATPLRHRVLGRRRHPGHQRPDASARTPAKPPRGRPSSPGATTRNPWSHIQVQTKRFTHGTQRATRIHAGVSDATRAPPGGIQSQPGATPEGGLHPPGERRPAGSNARCAMAPCSGRTMTTASVTETTTQVSGNVRNCRRPRGLGSTLPVTRRRSPASCRAEGGSLSSLRSVVPSFGLVASPERAGGGAPQ